MHPRDTLKVSRVASRPKNRLLSPPCGKYYSLTTLMHALPQAPKHRVKIMQLCHQSHPLTPQINTTPFISAFYLNPDKDKSNRKHPHIIHLISQGTSYSCEFYSIPLPLSVRTLTMTFVSFSCDPSNLPSTRRTVPLILKTNSYKLEVALLFNVLAMSSFILPRSRIKI